MDKKSTGLLPGERFGHLVVLGVGDFGVDSGLKRYECLCDCGNKTLVSRNGLVNQGIHQCSACAHRNNQLKCVEANTIVGSKYGSLEIVDIVHSYRKLDDRDKIVACVCDCGQYGVYRLSYLRNRAEKSTCNRCIETRRALGSIKQSQPAPKRPMARKGKISSGPTSPRPKASSGWAVQKERVLVRDKYTCSACGVHGGGLHVHHIIPLFVSGMGYEDGGIETDSNLITLCQECHVMVHKAIRTLDVVTPETCTDLMLSFAGT